MPGHDLLCINYQGSCCPWMGDCSCQCDCEFISKVREDMLTKCIVTVEKFDDVDEIELIIADLRDLQEKP